MCVCGILWKKSQGDLDDDVLDRLVELYCKVQKNVYCACLWPAGDMALADEAEAILRNECGKIIYDRPIKLSYTALRNFMIQIYGHQNWTGTIEDGHKGVDSKVEACYANREVRTIFFHCDSLEKVLAAKSRIRELFKIENHSVHISDTDEETRMMAGIVLNSNSRHFLEYGNIDFSKELDRVIKQVKSIDFIHREKVLMLPEATMAAYGLKELPDKETEAFVADEEQACGFFLAFDKNWKDYFCNPQCYFMLNDVKFIALPAIKKLNGYAVDRKKQKELQKIGKLLRRTGQSRRKQRNTSGYAQVSKKSVRERIKDKIVFVTQKLHIYKILLKVYLCLKK